MQSKGSVSATAVRNPPSASTVPLIVRLALCVAPRRSNAAAKITASHVSLCIELLLSKNAVAGLGVDERDGDIAVGCVEVHVIEADVHPVAIVALNHMDSCPKSMS